MALHTLGSVDVLSLVDARLQLHHAVQLVAAFAQSAVEPRDDDSHRALTWDANRDRFYSQPDASGLRVFVQPEPLAVGLSRESTDLSSLKLMGATLRTARAWTEGAVREATSEEGFELEWPEYDLPSHFVVEGRPFQAKAASMVELAHWYSGAQARLGMLVDSESDAGEVLTWPHHFDLATLIVVERDDDEAATKTVGVGMSPGDDSFSQPYWYVNAWGYSDQAAFPELQAPGHTHRDGWSGFVLTATELIEAGREGRADPAGEGERQRAALDSFLDRAVSSARALLEL